MTYHIQSHFSTWVKSSKLGCSLAASSVAVWYQQWTPNTCTCVCYRTRLASPGQLEPSCRQYLHKLLLLMRGNRCYENHTVLVWCRASRFRAIDIDYESFTLEVQSHSLWTRRFRGLNPHRSIAYQIATIIWKIHRDGLISSCFRCLERYHSYEPRAKEFKVEIVPVTFKQNQN